MHSAWASVALLGVSVSIFGCRPAPYSQEFSGQVLDAEGTPINGARVVNLVYRRCGSLGGASSELLKSSIAVTDAQGRYKNHISGVSSFYTLMLAGCGEFKFDSVACKAGFEPSPVLPAENATARLVPGVGWSHVNLPPECSPARVTEKQDSAVAKPAEKVKLPTEAPLQDIALWLPGKRMHIEVEDNGSGSPHVAALAPEGTALWLEIEDRIVGGRNFPSFKSLLPHPYRSQMGWLGNDRVTRTLVALGNAGPESTPAKRLPHGATGTKLEPIGGVQWSIYTASGNRRIKGPVIPRRLTAEEWIRLREELPSEMLLQDHISLFDPKGISTQAPPKSSGRYSAEVLTNERMTMPLWAPRTWMYSIVQDPGGPAAPYPDMPVIRAENLRQGAGFWLVASERKDRSAKSDNAELRRIAENDFFFTKNYAATGGDNLTTVFGFKRAQRGCQSLIKEPEPDAHMIAAGVGDPHIWLEPVGGIRWSVNILNGKRVGGPISLETVTENDWKHLRSQIAIFNKKPEQWQYVLCDPKVQ